MKISELRQTMETLRELLEVSDTRATTIKGLNDFIDILAARDDQTIDQFIAELEAAAGREQPLNDVVVRKHLQALNSAQLDRDAFERAFDALSNDKAVNSVEADMIFKQYHGRKAWRKIYGDKPRWRKRSDALKAIRTSFIERLTQEQKSREVAKATPW